MKLKMSLKQTIQKVKINTKRNIESKWNNKDIRFPNSIIY